jgi:hypothetical protein
METTFQSKLISNDKAGLVYQVTATAKGETAWFYLQVDEPKHKAFLRNIETGELDLADFGTVLYSGWGATPPEPIEARIKEQFDAIAA